MENGDIMKAGCIGHRTETVANFEKLIGWFMTD